MAEYAQVIVNISRQMLDHPFTYKVPAELQGKVALGSQVLVPFGKGEGTIRKGYIVGFTDTVTYPPEKIKAIQSVSAGSSADTGDQLVQLAAWMKHHYGSTMITALKTVLTGRKDAKPVEHRQVRLLLSAGEGRKQLSYYHEKHQVARERLLSALLEEPVLPYHLIIEKLHVTAPAMRAMKEQGVIAIETTRSLRNPVMLDDVGRSDLSLSPQQQAVVDGVTKDFDAIQANIRQAKELPRADADGTANDFAKTQRNKAQRTTVNGTAQTQPSGSSAPQPQVPTVSLIHGITGSGKTEVYIRIIEEIVRRGRQAIMLIPEISLTYQTLIRFYRHFGDRVSVMNSTLSESEKSDQFERARRGEIDVIIGPRSALFTPFPRLGVIVIDEEHESSYKNESMPRYHARDVAVQIAQMHHGVVVLGSATPSLESYYHATKGEYRLYELNQRLTGGSLPQVEIADMRLELQNGNRSILSQRLQALLTDRLEKGEQSMLFLNRRGFSGFVSCRSCGYVIRCPHCDVSLTLHKNGKLVCHYCGYEETFTHICPSCGSKYISGFHSGTEQVEEYIQKIYPRARILRMDADTTAKKGNYEKILSAFANEEADILIGTQMIVKGHDFPNVTLVGILLADLSLYANDYRAGERTFQLLTQAAGRAGRGKRPGNVVIQTYEPENYAIVHARAQDYKGFYKEEMIYRQNLMYPPAFHMLAILIQSKEEQLALLAAGRIRELLDKITAGINAHASDGWQTAGGRCHVDGGPQTKTTASCFPPSGQKNMLPLVLNIGPAPAGVSRIRDIYRYVVYIKCAKYDTLIHCKDRVEAYTAAVNAQLQRQGREIQVQFDFDPMNSF